MAEGAPDLSVVTVNWNTCSELRNLLRSAESAGFGGVEYIVVDNASWDDSVEMVRREFPSVRLIANDANLGFAGGCNLGIAASRGRYVMLLNPDSTIEQLDLPALLGFLDGTPDIGITGIKILNTDGSIQHSCRRFPTFQAAIFRNSLLSRLFPRNHCVRDYLMCDWDHDKPTDVDWVSGAALIMRRKLIDQVGALDERFFMYCEDVDIAFRARESGWRVVYFPGAVVTHAKGRSSDKSPNKMIIAHHKSMYRFFRKHYAAKSSVLTRVLVPLGAVLRASVLVARNSCLHAKWIVTHPGEYRPWRAELRRRRARIGKK